MSELLAALLQINGIGQLWLQWYEHGFYITAVADKGLSFVLE